MINLKTYIVLDESGAMHLKNERYFVILYVNSEWNLGDYVPGSASFEYGDELDKIIGAYGDGNEGAICR